MCICYGVVLLELGVEEWWETERIGDGWMYAEVDTRLCGN